MICCQVYIKVIHEYHLVQNDGIQSPSATQILMMLISVQLQCHQTDHMTSHARHKLCTEEIGLSAVKAVLLWCSLPPPHTHTNTHTHTYTHKHTHPNFQTVLQLQLYSYTPQLIFHLLVLNIVDRIFQMVVINVLVIDLTRKLTSIEH